MKPLSLWFILALAAAPLAQAQVHFDSGSAASRDARDGTRHVVRHEREVARRPVVLVKVRCHDGSRHIARVCRRHGGVASR